MIRMTNTILAHCDPGKPFRGAELLQEEADKEKNELGRVWASRDVLCRDRAAVVQLFKCSELGSQVSF